MAYTNQKYEDIIATRRSARAYTKYATRKIVFTERLDQELGATVSARTQFVFNIKTGNCNPSCALWAGGRAIYPTKQKLRVPAYCVRSNLTKSIYRSDKRTLYAPLSEKNGFPVGSDVIVMIAAQPHINVVATVREGVVESNKWYATIPPHVPSNFSRGVPVDVVLAQKTNMPVLEFMGRYKQGTAAEISLQYARAYDEYGVYIGEIAVQAETRSESWDILWTGRLEVCFRPANTAELILLDVVPADILSTNITGSIWTAKSVIRQYYFVAKTWAAKRND